MTPKEEAFARVSSCRGGVLLDTNVLLLLLIGAIDEGLIATSRLKAAYTSRDYQLLVWLVSRAQRYIVTPHVATETWDLGTNWLSGEHQRRFKQHFVRFVQQSRERWVRTQALVAEKYFLRLGVTDAGILWFKRSRPVVVTDDSGLSRQLEDHRCSVVNLTHLRDFD